MTEREAWTLLAEKFEAADGKPIEVRGATRLVCVAVSRLMGRSHDTTAVCDSMMIRMERCRPVQFGSVWWPINDTKSRAEFCRKMVQECEEENHA